MKFSPRMSRCVVLAGLLLLTTGCRYLSNRYYDFRDTFAIGGGVTHESKRSGVIPPSLGVYVEVTDLLHFGAIRHNGYTAELDLRGSFVGPESYSRIGFLWWQMFRKYQNYDDAFYYNAFKNRDFPWCQRMQSLEMQNRAGKPAKRLNYEYWANYRTYGTWMLHRGYQYWEYVGAEVAICDPLLTHFGLMARFGFDLSEVSDFLLGFTGYDYKHDDMSRDEYIVLHKDKSCWGLNLVPARPRRDLMPKTDEGLTTDSVTLEQPAPAPAPAPAAPTPEPVPAPAAPAPEAAPVPAPEPPAPAQL